MCVCMCLNIYTINVQYAPKGQLIQIAHFIVHYYYAII